MWILLGLYQLRLHVDFVSSLSPNMKESTAWPSKQQSLGRSLCQDSCDTAQKSHFPSLDGHGQWRNKDRHHPTPSSSHIQKQSYPISCNIIFQHHLGHSPSCIFLIICSILSFSTWNPSIGSGLWSYRAPTCGCGSFPSCSPNPLLMTPKHHHGNHHWHTAQSWGWSMNSSPNRFHNVKLMSSITLEAHWPVPAPRKQHMLN